MLVPTSKNCWRNWMKCHWFKTYTAYLRRGINYQDSKIKGDKYGFSQVFWSWWKSTIHILCLPVLSPILLIKALSYNSVLYLLLHLSLEELIVWQWSASYRWLANLCHYLDLSQSQFHIFNNVWQFPDILDPLKCNISNIKYYLFSPQKLFLPFYPLLIMTHSCICSTNNFLNAYYMDLNWMLWTQGKQFRSNPCSQGRGGIGANQQQLHHSEQTLI